MANKWIETFGIEIHAELNTVTKAFSPSKIDFDAEPNTMVHPVDLGYPGAKPTVNERMVEWMKENENRWERGGLCMCNVTKKMDLMVNGWVRRMKRGKGRGGERGNKSGKNEMEDEKR